MDQVSHHHSQPEPPDAGHTILFERSPLSVPLNLTDWLAPEILAGWINEAVDRLHSSNPEAPVRLNPPAEQPSGLLLRVLLFAYCTQNYANHDIVCACHTEPQLRDWCRDRVPFADEFEQFRRRNHLSLGAMLGELLIRAVREKFIQAGQLPAGLQHVLMGRAADRVEAAHQMSAEPDEE
jgi:hypothetical protein